jgi:tetratricopeptide (TPR) repeat protein
LTAVQADAQSAARAEELFTAGDYVSAGQIYNSILKRQPTHPLYLYRAARCAQETGDLASAETLFLKAGTKYPLRNFFLGEIYFSQWRMPEAIASYEAYLGDINEHHERYATVKERITQAQIIARYLKHVSRVEVQAVERLKKSDMLNAYPLSEEAGTLRLDSLGSSYTTQRNDRRYFSVREDSTGRVLIVNEQRLLNHWEQPDTLRMTINAGQTNAYPFVLTDGATLYFASDREGGLGGLDIYMTRYNAALGEWLPAENIGMPFNSPYNDYLFALDEQTGFACFATDRHYTESDSVEVYRLSLGERVFLRDLPAPELVALARMDSILAAAPATPAVAPALPTKPTTTGAKEQMPDSIYFVMSDDAVYTHLSDFRSDSARVLYEQYLTLEHEQQQAKQMLDSLRVQYSRADAPTRASLQARIPNLSSEIDERQRLLRKTLTTIRSLEAGK